MRRSSILGGLGLAFAAALVALPAPSHAAEVPAGTDITEGILVHVTPNGIGFMQDQVQYVVPPDVAVGDQSGTLFSCLFDSNTWRIKNTTVHVNVTKVLITPLEGSLKLHLEMNVSADARVETSGCLFNNGCQVHLPSSPVVADTIISLTMQADPSTGRPKVVADVPQFTTALALADPQISGCTLGDFFSFLVGLFHDTVQNAINGAIDSQVAPLLKPMIEDAFNSLDLNGSTNLAGTELDYDFYPTALEIHPGTIGIVMGGHFDTPTPAACVDPNRGSVVMGGDIPNYTELSPSGQPYHAAISIADDLVNQLVFSAWRGGLLCRDVTDAGGQPLTNDMLSLLGGGLDKIVTPGGPLVVHLEAQDPPLVMLGENGDTAEISISNLHVDLMSDVNERLARVMRVTLGTTAAINVSLNADHQLVITPNFDPSAIDAQVDYDELAPAAADSVISVLPTLVSALVPNLTDAIPPIDLPNLAGITIDSAEIVPDGPQNGFLSVYAGLGGQVSTSGCNAGGTGGCGISSPGGCTLEGGKRALASNLVSPMILALGLGVVAFRRRRDRD